MPFRKIKLETCTKCPTCGGLSGVFFTLKAKVKCKNFWGNKPSQWIQEEASIIGKGSKTAICIDCTTRIEIVE